MQRNEKGRGVYTTKFIPKKTVVCQYEGEIITAQEGRNRENTGQSGEYLFFVNSGGMRWCVDATRENNSKGRLINHSRENCNLAAKAEIVDGEKKLNFVSVCDIPKGAELLFDYNDRRSSATKAFPWLKF